MVTTVEYGLAKEGFKRKRLPEIIDSLNKRVADKLGIAIQTDSNSIFGQIHGIYAFELADLWELAENVYFAMYPHTATGISLSNAAALSAIRPIQAEQTIIICECTGLNNTRLPVNLQIQDENTNTYTIKEESKISSDNASKIELTIDNVENDKTYFITIDGEQKSYTAKISDNVSNVLTNIYNQFSKENLNFNLSNDLLTISSNDKTKIFSINTNLIIKNVSSPIYFVSDIYGSINPTLGSVKNINTFITGWNSVSNIKNIVGRDAETDVELRQRWSSSVYSKASVMLEAIQANIYSNVAGVTACLAYENDSDTVDSENRPPHSIEIIVEGGSEDDIAKEIYNYKAPGINTFGDIEKTVLDNQGISHLIRFNRPKQVKIWLKITITKNTEQTWGENTPNEIKEIILQEASKINIGEDIILQKFIGAIYNNINAIAYIDIKATTGETPKEYNNNNIVISAHENATFDISQIEVIINE